MDKFLNIKYHPTSEDDSIFNLFDKPSKEYNNNVKDGLNDNMEQFLSQGSSFPKENKIHRSKIRETNDCQKLKNGIFLFFNKNFIFYY